MTAPREQLGLFGEIEPARAKPFLAAVEPPADPQLSAIARALPPKLRMGTSSWTFPGWHGLLYFEEYATEKTFVAESLREYARHPLVRTVGIDRGYYAPIPEDELAAYAAQLPEDFLAVTKVWSEITTNHFPAHKRYGERAGKPNARFLDAALFEEAIGAPVRRTFASLQGPFVLEIPPSPAPVDPRDFAHSLEAFFTSAPSDFEYAVEVREPHLLTPRYLDVLRAFGVAHTFNLWSRMPSLADQVRKLRGLPGKSVVLRLLMPPGGNYEALKARFEPFHELAAPQDAHLDEAATLIEWALGHDKNVFVLLGNKLEGSSVPTMRRLAERILARQLPVDW